MNETEMKKHHEDFVNKFKETIGVVDSLIDDCMTYNEMSLMYDYLENRTRRCDVVLTKALGDNWWEEFNHYFTGD